MRSTNWPLFRPDSQCQAATVSVLCQVHVLMRKNMKCWARARLGMLPLITLEHFFRYLGGENGHFRILVWDVNRAVQRVLAQ